MTTPENGGPDLPAMKEGAMYQLSIYPITPTLWRWEIRCGGALLRCGTAPTKLAAERSVSAVINTGAGSDRS